MSTTLTTTKIILPGTLRPGILRRPPQCRCSRSFVRSEDLHQGTDFPCRLGLVYMGLVILGFRGKWSDDPSSCYELPFGLKN